MCVRELFQKGRVIDVVAKYREPWMFCRRQLDSARERLGPGPGPRAVTVTLRLARARSSAGPRGTPAGRPGSVPIPESTFRQLWRH